MQKSLAKNSIYNIIYTMGDILFPFFTSIYVSRILLPVGVGRVAAAQNITSYFVTIAALGLPSYGVREFAKVREHTDNKNKLFTELFLINIVSTTIAVVGYYILLFINVNFRHELLLYAVCGLSVLFNYLNIDWMYQGLEEYGYIAGRSLVIKAISFFSLLVFVRNREDYVLYALISCLAIGGNYFFNIIHARNFVHFDFSKIEMRRHLKPVFVIACIIFLSSIYSKVDITMLNILATDESVGYYSYAQKTVNIVLVLSNAVTAAFLPRLSYYYENEREGFYKLLKNGLNVLCFMAVPFTAGMFLVAPQAVELLYGEVFAPAATTIRWMCPLILIKGFGNLYCYQLVYSTKSEKIILPASASASIANIAANAILIPKLLQNGAVIASVLSELITNTIQFLYMKKKIQFQIDIRPIYVSIITTTLMSLVVLVVMQIHLSNILKLLLEVFCGGIVYIAANLALKNTLIYEILRKIILKNKK